jgi:putative GTP pyrophosphokinase
VPGPALPPEAEAAIEVLIRKYLADGDLFRRIRHILEALPGSESLATLIHSYKTRVKEPEHLRDKLRRKWRKAQAASVECDVTVDNLYDRINDLAGLRLLHLHTLQFPAINAALGGIFVEDGYEVIEGPTARTWDDEYRRYFESIGVATVGSERMYTSVHYVIKPNKHSKISAEIQVRTLAEELWGEVDHSINYPTPSEVLACQEQIKVLARVTSSCTRLVDSIFRTNAESRGKRP